MNSTTMQMTTRMNQPKTVGFVKATVTALVVVVVLVLGVSAPSIGQAAELFGPVMKSTETFIVHDAAGRVPTFRVLKDTPSDRTLAIAVLTTLNLQPEVQPKLPLTDYIDLKIEAMTLAPVAGSNTDLTLTVKVSGHEMELPKKVNKTDFLSGKPIELNFPKEERQVAVFDVNSNGKLRFKLLPGHNEIQIDEAVGHVKYDSSFLGSGDETVKFTGTATRKL